MEYFLLFFGIYLIFGILFVNTLFYENEIIVATLNQEFLDKNNITWLSVDGLRKYVFLSWVLLWPVVKFTIHKYMDK